MKGGNQYVKENKYRLYDYYYHNKYYECNLVSSILGTPGGFMQKGQLVPFVFSHSSLSI